MFDINELLDLIDLLYEYNIPPSINDIYNELFFSKEKIYGMLNVLKEYKIIKLSNSMIEIICPYEKAVLILESLNTFSN